MKIDTTDPIGTEKLGRQLAKLVDGPPGSVVLVGDTTEDAVLGHIVGRELGVPVIRIYDEEGLAMSAAPIPSGARGVLVSDTMSDHLIDTAKALLARAGGQLINVAALTQLEES